MEESKKKTTSLSFSLQHEELFPSIRRDQELPKNESLEGIVVFQELLHKYKGGEHTACTYVDFQKLNYKNTTLLHAEKMYAKST